MNENTDALIEHLQNMSVNIPIYVFEDLEELSYEYFQRLKWIGEDYPNPACITNYKEYISEQDCKKIYNFLYTNGKSLLLNKIKNIDYFSKLEYDIIDAMFDDYINKFYI